ncbi:MAG: ribosomal L7Ae/L30e/S12e/Gadd45 family protein [Bacilli bacterium]
MSNEEVSNYVVGRNQTLREIKKGTVSEVLLANDSDVCIINNVVSVAEAHCVKVTYVSTMVELGRQFGIDVGAATVAKLVN